MGKNISKTKKQTNISAPQDNSEPKKLKSVIYAPLPKDRPPTKEELDQRKSNAFANMCFIISIVLIYYMLTASK